jgi:lipid-binding SYLF domain-containing protein
MKLMKWLAAAATLTAFGLSSAMAADKAKQDEVLKAAQTTLADFYKADPKLKGQVEKAPGYAAFTTFGISFLVGGAGGKGVVHDNATKKDTFMELAQASAGVQIGASDMRYLFIFDTPASMQQFIDKGWDASASASAGAGATGKGSTGASAGSFTGGKFYQLTTNGLQAGVAAGGTKVWKDKSLN